MCSVCQVDKKHVKMTIDSDDRCRSFWEKQLNDGKARKFFCATGTKDNAPFDYDEPLYIKVDVIKINSQCVINLRFPVSPRLFSNSECFHLQKRKSNEMGQTFVAHIHCNDKSQRENSMLAYQK